MIAVSFMRRPEIIEALAARVHQDAFAEMLAEDTEKLRKILISHLESEHEQRERK